MNKILWFINNVLIVGKIGSVMNVMSFLVRRADNYCPVALQNRFNINLYFLWTFILIIPKLWTGCLYRSNECVLNIVRNLRPINHLDSCIGQFLGSCWFWLGFHGLTFDMFILYSKFFVIWTNYWRKNTRINKSIQEHCFLMNCR